MAQKGKKLGSISVDTDSLSDVYSAYHNTAQSENNVTYDIILPRYLKLFKKHGIKATFFIIGRHLETKKNKIILKKLVREGHELANHSYSHHFNFSRLSVKARKEEITKCYDIIYDTTGYQAVGFRAPAWDIDSKTLHLLQRLGYKYDSSLFPSYFTYIAQLYQIFIAKSKTESKSMGKLNNIFNSFTPSGPYNPNSKFIWARGSMKITEIPLTVSPILKVPFYGSFQFKTKSKKIFDSTAKSVAKFSDFMNYELHSMELFDRDDDPVSVELKSLQHPSFQLSFKEKILFYNYMLKSFKKNYDLKPLCESNKNSMGT